ncbi:hypothetical protein FIBSPDRAFT_979102 [Athelia psychrophila]|uniref:Uncharacterized protein n=1 Tax=Athelia psychrophila TaxID=1759441 RepID=A0A166DSI8_9AGAM|nr:hypothetical protein FIBSPDRAFT_979102 [Fibularhizoctonia sp. CBS 109695]
MTVKTRKRVYFSQPSASRLARPTRIPHVHSACKAMEPPADLTYVSRQSGMERSALQIQQPSGTMAAAAARVLVWTVEERRMRTDGLEVTPSTMHDNNPELQNIDNTSRRCGCSETHCTRKVRNVKAQKSTARVVPMHRGEKIAGLRRKQHSRIIRGPAPACLGG